MTGATALVTLALTALTQTGAISLPASQAYVDKKIEQATVGLPYLVKSQIERDVDGQWYLVSCMSRYELQGALNRLVDEFKKLTGETYTSKPCERLEEILQVTKK